MVCIAPGFSAHQSEKAWSAWLIPSHTERKIPPVHCAIGSNTLSQNHWKSGCKAFSTLFSIEITFVRVSRKRGTISFAVHVPRGIKTSSQNHNRPSPTWIAKGAKASHKSRNAALIFSQSTAINPLLSASTNLGIPSPKVHCPTGTRNSL